MSNAKSCHTQARKKTNKHAVKHVIKQRTPLPAQLQQQQRNKSSPNRQQRRRQRRRRRRFPQQRNHRTNSMATRRRRTTTRGCVCQHPATEANPPREKRITRRIFLIEDTNIFTVVHFYLLYLQIVVNCLERTWKHLSTTCSVGIIDCEQRFCLWNKVKYQCVAVVPFDATLAGRILELIMSVSYSAFGRDVIFI